MHHLPSRWLLHRGRTDCHSLRGWHVRQLYGKIGTGGLSPVRARLCVLVGRVPTNGLLPRQLCRKPQQLQLSQMRIRIDLDAALTNPNPNPNP